MPFITQWKQANSDVLMAQVGSATESHPHKFLDGIYFAPSFSTSTVPYLQRVFMADACHLHFGKYALFGCYGVMANSNMSPVGFAIIFGNKNGESWRAFWKFITSLHPEMNADDVTVITNQDKGHIGRSRPGDAQRSTVPLLMALPPEYYEEVWGRWGEDTVFGHVDVQQACWSPFSSATRPLQDGTLP
jgi:hypothetical protein